MSDQTPSKKMADYLKVVWKRKWILLALLVLSVGGSILYYHQQEPLYKTSMKVQLSSTSTTGGQPGGEVGMLLKSLVDTDSVKMTQLAVLTDPSTKRLMVENKIVKADKRPEYFRGRTQDDILDEILSSVRVINRRGTQLIAIEVTGPKPDLLPWIARQFWDQFNDMHKSMQGAIMNDGLVRVSRESDSAQREYREKEKELATHLATTGYTRTSLETTRSWYTSEHSRLNAAMAKIQSDLALDRGVAEKVGEALDGEGDAGLTTFDDQDFLKSSSPLQEAKEALAQLKLEHRRLREEDGLGANHGRVLAAEQAIGVVGARIAKMRRTLCDLFVSTYEGKVALEGQLKTQFDDLRRKIEVFEDVDGRFEELSRELDMRKDQYELLARAHEQLMNERDKSVAVGGIIIEPDLPRAPFSPDLLLILGAGLMIGLILGAGLTLGLEAIDDSIRAEDEVEQALKLPCLGVIHTPDSRRGGTPAVDLASIVDPRSIFAEEFRSIRTSLGFTFDRRRERHYSMLVTSFEVQEGKTTVSTNLATVIAASGLRTLLVDADMRNGRIHRTFGLTSERGLSDVLAGEAKVEDVVEDTEIANLSVLPAGSLYDNPAEMLESPEMRQLLETLSEKYDRVVFDTPPAGPVTDSFVLGKQVDAVILIAAAGKSRKRLLKRTVKNMLAIGIRIAGVVLNEMKPGRKRYYRKYLHLYRRGA